MDQESEMLNFPRKIKRIFLKKLDMAVILMAKEFLGVVLDSWFM